MGRRIINRNDSDSLKVEQRRSDSAKSAANAAEVKIKVAGQQLADINSDIAKAIEKRDDFEVRAEEAKTATAVADSAYSFSLSELRRIEGEISSAQAELVKVKDDTQKAKSAHAETMRVLTKGHSDQVAAYENTQSTLLLRLDDIETLIKTHKDEVTSLGNKISLYETEEKRLKKYVLPAVNKAKGELDSLAHYLLVKQVEVKRTEKEYIDVKAQYHSEKVLFEEAEALRLGEETIIAENMQKLVDKESEVDRKMRNLRTLQTGIDQSTKRLKRREEEIELKMQLSKTEVN